MALAPACQPRGRRGAERGFSADFCGFCPDIQGPLTIARRSPDHGQRGADHGQPVAGSVPAGRGRR